MIPSKSLPRAKQEIKLQHDLAISHADALWNNERVESLHVRDNWQ